MDADLPGIGAAGLLARIHEDCREISAIVMATEPNIARVVDAMRAGAADVLPKPASADEILASVTQRMAEALRVQSTLSRHGSVAMRLATLTPREYDILRRVVRGDANKIMASDLNLSQRTVEYHRASVMKKMQAASVPDLVRMMVEADSLGLRGNGT